MSLVTEYAARTAHRRYIRGANPLRVLSGCHWPSGSDFLEAALHAPSSVMYAVMTDSAGRDLAGN